MKLKCVSPDTLHHALDGDYESALVMWERVAECARTPGDPEPIYFMQEVARRILDAADREIDRRRWPEEVAKATGLAGWADPARALRDRIVTFKELSDQPIRGEALFDYVRALPEFAEYVRKLPAFKASGLVVRQYIDDLDNRDFHKIVGRILSK